MGASGREKKQCDEGTWQVIKRIIIPENETHPRRMSTFLEINSRPIGSSSLPYLQSPTHIHNYFLYPQKLPHHFSSRSIRSFQVNSFTTAQTPLQGYLYGHCLRTYFSPYTHRFYSIYIFNPSFCMKFFRAASPVAFTKFHTRLRHIPSTAALAQLFLNSRPPCYSPFSNPVYQCSGIISM